MIVDFKFSNYMSYFYETFLTLKANADSAYKGINTFSTVRGELLKSVMIFGANGSGKSNFIGALAFVCDLVLSKIDLQCEKIAGVNHFAFNEDSYKRPSSFEITFISERNCYVYGFSLLAGKVNQEYLYRKNQRQTEMFYRSSPAWQDIRITKDFENMRHLIQNTRDDALFLSWANFANNKMAMDIYKWFQNVRLFDASDGSQLLFETINYYTLKGKDNLVEFFKDCDIGIEDFNLKIREEPIVNEENYKKGALKELPKRTVVDVEIKHAFYDINWQIKDHFSFPFAYESAGAKKIFELSGSLLNVLEGGGVVVIDEFDTKLHPMLVNHIIKLFNSQKNNKAQIICTTHNASLLDEPLRRDQFCIAAKDQNGTSKLAKISDFKNVRKNGKLMKMYLQGVFDGIPHFE